MSKKITTTKEPIHDFRIEAGKTLDEVSKQFPVNVRTLIRWERGDPRIPVKHLDRAKVVYGKPVSEIRPDLARQFEAHQ